uniref:Pro-neuregulin-1, membrane-bound isoform-like n=1 Tax=Petromyzon marinus TaxID=7757 RepID=A0AAJ7WKE2_PETMA|nr:pro-neuregulin-1, membrane-bound isoform-like [Petromyzon marinus]
MRAKWRPLVAVLEGEKLVLKCEASGSAEYAWLLNGVRLKKGKGVRITTKKGISRLTISRVGSLHSGPLSCQASNSLGITAITTTVSVTSKP